MSVPRKDELFGMLALAERCGLRPGEILISCAGPISSVMLDL